MNLKPTVFFLGKILKYWELTSVWRKSKHTKSPDLCVAVITFYVISENGLNYEYIFMDYL